MISKGRAEPIRTGGQNSPNLNGKFGRLGRSLPHFLSIITDFRACGIAFRSLIEAMDTTTPHGELLFSMFGALAEYERALTRERVVTGLAGAKRRERQGGRSPMIDAEKIEAITAALDGGASKAAVCRNFDVAHSTLIDTLARIGWTVPADACTCLLTCGPGRTSSCSPRSQSTRR